MSEGVNIGCDIHPPANLTFARLGCLCALCDNIAAGMFLDAKYSFTICPLKAFVRPYHLATAVQLIFSVESQVFASFSNALVSKTDSRRCVLYPCMCAFPSCVFDSFRSTAFSLVSSPNVFLMLSNVLVFGSKFV